MITVNPLIYAEALQYLKSFEKSTIKLGLERINSLLELIGSPHKKLNSIHIAGTNGKGSTAAFLDTALAHQGSFVGRFVSPHLITPRERIVIDGKPLTRQWFSAACSYLKEIVSKYSLSPSYFEFLTAMSFHIFGFLNVDYSIVETGMGGRLDATNTIYPKLTIITSISVDHSEFLGKSEASIAMEKAGIMKQGVPVITSAKGEALDVLRLKAASLSCPFYDLNSISFQCIAGDYPDVSIKINNRELRAKSSLKGSFQGENLGLAMAAYCLLTGKDDFYCENVVWPARFENFETNPEIVVDGAHNPDAIVRLLQNFEPKMGDCLIFGCMKDKDVDLVFESLESKFMNIILTSGNYHRFMSKEDFLQKSFSKYKFIPLDEIVDYIGKFDRVLVTGSLHLIGDFLQEIVKHDHYKNKILKKNPYNFIFDSFPF